MKGKVVGCLSAAAEVTTIFMVIGTVVVVHGLRELNSMLDGDTIQHCARPSLYAGAFFGQGKAARWAA